MEDLYVCGLDLSTGRVVQPDEREVWQWHEKGHNGDGTLVCLECYHGAGSPDGAPRLVPLVPRGQVGGIVRRHFAHPPGTAPSGGHTPETAWHWEVKHRLCRWALAAGAHADVEAWTATGKRRSDVAVTFRGGARLAIEVQLSRITDTELLARRRDYAREGTALVWVWHPDRRIPHVLYKFGEPGWAFNPATGQMGLACGRPHPAWPGPPATRDQSPHWPPCPGDHIEMRWMPLGRVRLTESGFAPSPEVTARLEEEAAEAALRAQASTAAVGRASAVTIPETVNLRGAQDGRARPQPAGHPYRTRLAIRVDARPPWSHPLSRLYWCPQCGFLTGAQLQDSPFPHEIPGPDRWITRADLHPASGR